MWDSIIPIRTDWPGGAVQPSEVLYEIDGPTIFVALVGLAKLLFFKVDELEGADIFVACQIGVEELSLLKEGRISADSDEGGHLFQFDRGHHSDLMAAGSGSSRGPVC